MKSFYLSLFSLLIITTTSFAQHKMVTNTKKVLKKNLCVNDKHYSPEELKQLQPFDKAVTVKIVSFSKLEQNNKDRVFTGLIKSEGVFDTTNLKEQIILDASQVAMLSNILYNYGNKILPPNGQVNCYLPNNAILFYDARGKIISCIELSFGCETTRISPSRIMIGSCSQKFDVLREFFERAGMHFFGDFE